MSNLIKQLETIGQNAEQRYRKQAFDKAQLQELNAGAVNQALMFESKMRAVFVVGEE